MNIYPKQYVTIDKQMIFFMLIENNVILNYE